MRRKKKGASLITVVVIFAILITLGTAALSLTATDYNLRIGESKRVKNLYYSESGVDVTYGVMGKVVEKAIYEGNRAVDTFMTSLNGSGGIIELQRENIKNGEAINGEKYIDNAGNIDEAKIKTAQNETFKAAFRNYLTSEYPTAGSNVSRIIYCLENNVYFNDTGAEVSVNFQTAEKPNIVIAGARRRVFSQDDKLDLNIESSFQTSVTATSTANMPFKRTIGVTYTINVPNYNDTYYVQTEKKSINVNPLMKRAIAIDGDLTINGNFQVDGDIFVKGRESGNAADKVYDKYKGGILIQGNNGDDKKVVFKGIIATAKSFNVKGTNTVEILPSDNSTDGMGKLYAGNAYVGKSTQGETDSYNSNLKVSGQVYTDNDLALNARNSHINIDEYYGISDSSDTPVSGSVRGSYTDERMSSCIIVNSDDIDTGSTVSINRKAYIMGTAYIKTGPVFQTGESVSVKGNYRAYANELNNASGENSYLKGGNVYFGYYTPLQLADKYKSLQDNSTKDMIVTDKSKYFNLYANEKGMGVIKGTGISLPANTASETNTITIGAYVSKSNDGRFLTYPENYSDGIHRNLIDEKRTNYAREVFEMGNDTGSLLQKYKLGIVDKYVSNQVDFNNVVNYIEPTKHEVIINNDPSKTIIIYGKNTAPVDNSTTISVNATSGKASGIIVTKGNVIIKGEATYTGSIIAAGDVTSENDGALKKIKYDMNYVYRLIARNYEKFKNNSGQYIFDSSIQEPKVIEINDEVSIGGNDTAHNNISDKIIAKSRWRIVK
ncbi:hypothetical protein HMPREF1982_01183 [Clostridiales bacterium oral taxon 876 str. F0540]|nr:hypothetical protein HMPREF1982_01183 [Clostridiales bacterium oral taxon 876 str. F0540]